MDAIAASSRHIRLDRYSASPRRKRQGGAIQVLPEYMADSMTIDDRPALAFTLQSGGLYNLTKQEKTIPISNGIRRIGELSPSHQAIIERFLQTIAHPKSSAADEPEVAAKPAENRVRENQSDREESDDRITLLDMTWERRSTGSVRAYIRVKNTTGTTFNKVHVTFMFETASGSLLNTENSRLDPSIIEPGDVATAEALVLDASTDIDHFTVKFESEGKTVRYKRR
jgi:hypothetical protein